jgi:hypothetical protein
MNEHEQEQSEWEERNAGRRYEARRERFATAAMRAMLVSMRDHPYNWNFDLLADAAVSMADALEERLHPDPNKPLIPPYEA